MSFSTRFPAVQKECFDVQQEVQALVTGAESSRERQTEVAQRLNALFRELDSLRSALRSEASGRRDVFELRLSNLEGECISMRQSVERFLNRAYVQHQEAREREELLAGYRETSAVVLDLYEAEGASLRRSTQLVDEYIEQGAESLGRMVEQRKRLERTHSTLRQVDDLLGLSGALIRLMLRIQTSNRFVLFGGMLVVLLVLAVVLRLR